MTGLHRIDNNFQWPSLEAKNIKNLIYKKKNREVLKPDKSFIQEEIPQAFP